MRRQTVASHPGTPCRVSLVDAAVGETVLLLPYEHQAAPGSPYRSSGAIFVRQGAEQAQPGVNEVPDWCAAACSRCARTTPQAR